MVNYLTQNSKIKKMTGVKTFNWGIPAYQSVTGLKTCPWAGSCAKGCYARQGAYIWGNVSPAFERRLALSQSPEFIDVLDAEIKRRKVSRLRIHDSGDFYSKQYRDAWYTIMMRNPLVEFYAYTKALPLFKCPNDRPVNFTVIFSEGGTRDTDIDITRDRHSRVFTNEAELLAAGYVNASKDDANALGPNHRIGLIYHGAKSKAFSTATKAQLTDIDTKLKASNTPKISQKIVLNILKDDGMLSI